MTAFEGIAHALAEGYRDGRCQHIGRGFIPSREEITTILETLLAVLYPGYFGDADLRTATLEEHVVTDLVRAHDALVQQVHRCLCLTSAPASADASVDEATTSIDRAAARASAERISEALLRSLPEVRKKLVLDAQAAFDGDPAARSLDEVVLAYPGFLAISVYRVAHELYRLEVPLMPRIMSEWAHTRTGADIHPGATIGERFFIDHATGVVIGETTVIGDGVRLYQGVTLGALSLPRDEVSGRVIRGQKRHPTVEDDVTIYANATVLGGSTVVGKGSVVGGSVFLTKSVPPGQRVAVDAPKLRVLGEAPKATPSAPDFEI